MAFLAHSLGLVAHIRLYLHIRCRPGLIAFSDSFHCYYLLSFFFCAWPRASFVRLGFIFSFSGFGTLYIYEHIHVAVRQYFLVLSYTETDG